MSFIEESPRSIDAQPKERILDSEIGNLISAIGNHGAKALTLLSMLDGAMYTMDDLSTRMMDYQGHNPGWRFSKVTPFDYCRLSLSPVGLVTREILNPDLSSYAYQISDYGRRAGVPLAGLLLDFSERYDLPLSKVFGSTASSSHLNSEGEQSEDEKRRAPMTTLRILQEVHTETDQLNTHHRVSERLKLKGSVASRHLKRLSGLGLVNYDRGKVSLTDDQRIVITNLLEIVYGFQDQDQDILKKGRDLAYEILVDPVKFSAHMRRAMENSGHANARPRIETEGLITALLSGRGMGNGEIRKLLEEVHGIRLRQHTVEKITGELAKEGKIKSSTGRPKVYTLGS